MKNSQAEWIIKLLKEYDTTVQKSIVLSEYDKKIYRDKISDLIAWVRLADVTTSTSEREMTAEIIGDDLVRTVTKKKTGFSAKEMLEAITKNDDLDEEDEPVIIDF